MQKYGIIVNGELKIVAAGTPGAKPIKFAEVPAFDQLTQAVFMGEVTDEGDYISVGVEIREVEIDEDEFGGDFGDLGFGGSGNSNS